MTHRQLDISTPQREGTFQASKWLKFQVLCDAAELRDLWSRLTPFAIYPLTGIGAGEPLDPDFFAAEYSSWIEGLKQGVVPTDAQLRRILACALSDDRSALWLQEIPGKGFLVKIRKPLVQVQAHSFSYSALDGVFRPMSMGPHSIFWGLQFSFPQIYQEGASMEMRETEENRLFEEIRLWVRNATRPTPFLVEGKKINAPIRLGKNCFSWIGRHPQLIQQHIGVMEAAHAH